MGQVTQAFPHLELERVKQKLKQADKYWERQKWLVIYNAMIDPRPCWDCKARGVSKGFVRQVIQQYNRQGEAAVSRPKAVGGTVIWVGNKNSD